MDKLDELFIKMVDENSKSIVKVIKDTLLRELCELCYDILMEKAMQNQEIIGEELYEEVLKRMEKDAS